MKNPHRPPPFFAALVLLAGAIGNAHRAIRPHAQPPGHDAWLHWTIASVAAILAAMLLWRTWRWWLDWRRTAPAVALPDYPWCEVCNRGAFSVMRDTAEQPMMCRRCYGVIVEVARGMLRRRQQSWLDNL